MSKTITLPDGSKCHKGANCQRHGTKAQGIESAAKIEQLKTQIDSLFTVKETQECKSVETLEEPLPEWWSESRQQGFESKKELFQKFGMKDAKIPTFSDRAMRDGYIEIETGDKDTRLIIGTDGNYYKDGENYSCKAWMYKQGKPVAMLRFSTWPKDYTPPQGTYPFVESIVSDIEVNKEHLGKKYGLEIIRQVEKNALDGRLLHSTGGYTPEGRKSLGSLLPHTDQAKKDYKKVFAAGQVPHASYEPMVFVHNWEMLQTLT